MSSCCSGVDVLHRDKCSRALRIASILHPALRSHGEYFLGQFSVDGKIRQDLRPSRFHHDGVFDAHAPGAGVEAAVSHGDDDVGRQRRRRLLAVEEGVARRQGRLLELDADAVDRRAEEVIAVSPVPDDAVESLVELRSCRRRSARAAIVSCWAFR